MPRISCSAIPRLSYDTKSVLRLSIIVLPERQPKCLTSCNKSVIPGMSYQEYLTKAVSQECHTIISRVSYKEYLTNLTRVSHQSVSPRLSRQQGHTDRATPRASHNSVLQQCPTKSALTRVSYKAVTTSVSYKRTLQD